MTDKVIMPIGWGAGKDTDLTQALQALAVEMLSHKSDLLEKARRQPQAAEALKACALDMERYSTALWLIWWQLEDPDKREQHISGSLAGMVEVARRLGLTLPPELST